jgi:hypothetical protein
MDGFQTKMVGIDYLFAVVTQFGVPVELGIVLVLEDFVCLRREAFLQSRLVLLLRKIQNLVK